MSALGATICTWHMCNQVMTVWVGQNRPTSTEEEVEGNSAGGRDDLHDIYSKVKRIKKIFLNIL